MSTAMLLMTSQCGTMTSQQLDGDFGLSPGSSGRILLNFLRQATTDYGFLAALKKFHRLWYGQPIMLHTSQTKKRLLAMDDFYHPDDPELDYLYLLHLGPHQLTVQDHRQKLLRIFPGELVVFYRGQFHVLEITY